MPAEGAIVRDQSLAWYDIIQYHAGSTGVVTASAKTTSVAYIPMTDETLDRPEMRQHQD